MLVRSAEAEEYQYHDDVHYPDRPAGGDPLIEKRIAIGVTRGSGMTALAARAIRGSQAVP